jgi:uncharacterized membrane protein (UPF0127 family)
LPQLTSRRAIMLASIALFAWFAGSPSTSRAGQALRREPLEIVTRHGVRRFTVEIADTDAARELGLMNRKALSPDRGMLFDFKSPQPVAFWMKNTLIPLDMIFIDKDGQIISIAANATPLSEKPIPSGGDVLGVLEIGGGRAGKDGVRVGDRVLARMFHR